MRLLVKFPTRQRPERCLHVLRWHQQKLSRKHDVQFFVTCDDDDPSMNNVGMRAALAAMADVTTLVGSHKTKVEAVNAGIPDDYWDILLVTSDDFTPVVQGYDDVICGEAQKVAPHSTYCFLHFNDGHFGNRLCTLPIMGRDYYLKHGIYHEGYRAFFCDDEMTEVARRSGAYRYVDQVLLRHDHFVHGEARAMDDLDKRNKGHWGKDQTLFGRRKKAGFGVR